MLQNIQILVSQIIVMFLLIGVGAFCYRKKYINDDGAGQLSFILTRIVAPCVVIDSFQREFDPALGKALILSVLCTCTAMGLSILVSHLIFRKNGSHANFADKRFCVVFTNCGFMGLPLLDALYGSEGLFLGSAFIMVNNLLLWTYGVGQLSRDVPRAERLRNTFINPGVISNLIGLFCFLTPFKLPVVPATAVSYLASLNTPIAMIAVGAFLAQCDLRECFRDTQVYFVSVLRLLDPAAHHARGVPAPAARSHAALLHAHSARRRRLRWRPRCSAGPTARITCSRPARLRSRPFFPPSPSRRWSRSVSCSAAETVKETAKRLSLFIPGEPFFIHLSKATDLRCRTRGNSSAPHSG